MFNLDSLALFALFIMSLALSLGALYLVGLVFVGFRALSRRLDTALDGSTVPPLFPHRPAHRRAAPPVSVVVRGGAVSSGVQS